MKRILVINDEQEILELLHDLLSEEGYEVLMYSYAIEELAEIKRLNPDLIILDLMMGDHQPRGWQTLQKLKLDQATAFIPVIVCTAAERSVEEQQGYLLSKGVLVVLKPFNIEDLVESVRKAFSLLAPSLEVRE
jgi:two-component system, OmpR family, response regulator VicR